MTAILVLLIAGITLVYVGVVVVMFGPCYLCQRWHNPARTDCLLGAVRAAQGEPQ